MARENAVLCPHCNRGPFVDLLQHAAIYGGRVYDAYHLELALRLTREERAAKSAMMAQFGKEVSDDDGDGNQAEDGRGAEEGVGTGRRRRIAGPRGGLLRFAGALARWPR